MKQGRLHRRTFIYSLSGVAVVCATGRVWAAANSETLVRIDLGKKRVSGFLAELEGNTYVFTNAQLISGHDRFTISTLSGEPIPPKKIELSATRDLARFLVDKRKALPISPTVSVGDLLTIYDYSTPGSVEPLPGSVAKLYGGRFRAESGFSENHYGSPVVKEEGSVCGIATIVNFYKYADGSWDSTTMRTVYQLDGDKWYTPNWKKYNASYGKMLRETDEFRNEVYGLSAEWIKNTKSTLEPPEDRTLSLDVERWIKQHNGMVTAIEKAQKKRSAGDRYSAVRKDFKDSCDLLVKLCIHKAKTLEFLSKDDKIAPFLKNEFMWRARELSKFTGFIRYHENKTLDRNW